MIEVGGKKDTRSEVKGSDGAKHGSRSDAASDDLHVNYKTGFPNINEANLLCMIDICVVPAALGTLLGKHKLDFHGTSHVLCAFRPGMEKSALKPHPRRLPPLPRALRHTTSTWPWRRAIGACGSGPTSRDRARVQGVETGMVRMWTNARLPVSTVCKTSFGAGNQHRSRPYTRNARRYASLVPIAPPLFAQRLSAPPRSARSPRPSPLTSPLSA
ncbi:uncharacterized protein C8Q71DRAFT_854753 [Rhodofomes roseus]|uniref:Uncharacterized protein n=1 Tax=Rhodofomes roseus TaxID=34475 RepID=A0ABQ8KRC7_9APHY|nr:uncharacterized protein C8Q71DRAFT_854753 [Rhodofomes roseus]KAH9840899.1 hypothetical protein C8Q71DRAFT_854753 [Rhodofomes roseus]